MMLHDKEKAAKLKEVGEMLAVESKELEGEDSH